MKLPTAVIIPIYKSFSSLSKGEIISLNSCVEFLKAYHVIFICSKGLDTTKYECFLNDKKITVTIERFNYDYFHSLNGYNQLLKSKSFYRRFIKFQYILIFQTDAMVLKNELEYWCNKGYDFIGAPWFDNWGLPKQNNIIGVGNGGFSLRKVQSALIILSRIEKLRILRKFWFESYFQAFIKFNSVAKMLQKYFKIMDIKILNTLLTEHNVNEDLFWTQLVAKTFKDYKVADIPDAIKFSFEVNPKYLYEMNNLVLPFGCHAWEKYEPEFWEEILFNKKGRNV